MTLGLVLVFLGLFGTLYLAARSQATWSPAGPGRWLLSAMPRQWQQNLEKALDQSGSRLAPERWVSTVFLVSLGFAVLTVVVRQLGADPLFFGVVSLAVAVLSPLYLHQKRLARLAEIEKALPLAMDLLSMMTLTGIDFEMGLRKTVAELDEGPLVEELKLTLHEIQLGQGRTAALRALSKRVPLRSIGNLVTALIQAEERGVALSGVLEIQSETLRTHKMQAAEARAMRAPVLMLFPLMFCIMPNVFLVLLAPIFLRGFGL